MGWWVTSNYFGFRRKKKMWQLHTNVCTTSHISCVKRPNRRHYEYGHGDDATWGRAGLTVSTLGVTLRSSWLRSKLLQRPGLPTFLSADSLCSSFSVAAVFLEAGTEAENKIFQHWLYDTPKIKIRKLRAFLEMQRPERLPCPPPWKASRIEQEGLCGLQCALTGQGFQPATHHSLRKSASEKKSCSNDPRWRDMSAPPPGFRPGGRADEDHGGDEGSVWRFLVSGNESFARLVLFSGSCLGAGCFLAEQPGGGRREGVKGAKSTRRLSPSVLQSYDVNTPNTRGKGASSSLSVVTEDPLFYFFAVNVWFEKNSSRCKNFCFLCTNGVFRSQHCAYSM